MWNLRGNRLGKWLQEADWHSVHATRAFEEGDLVRALRMADRAVKLSRKIYRRDGTAGLWTREFAERLRTRAEIHRARGAYRDAVADATEAIPVFEKSGFTEFPLFVPDLRLMLAELHTALGEREPALRHAEAIESYRRQARESDDEHDQLLAARALARYAEVTHALGETSRADEATRECVTLLRPRVAQIHLVKDLDTFARTVDRLVASAEPPNADAAVELVPLLQDAIDQMVRTIPESPLAYRYSETRRRVMVLLKLLERQGSWLVALGARRLAVLVDHQSRHLVDRPVRAWPAVLAQLRKLMEQAVRLRADPPDV